MYGSDAIAGVVNFGFNNAFKGVQIEAGGGVTEQGDGTTASAAITWGGRVDDDRDQLFLSLSYLERNNASRDSRRFFDDRMGSLTSTAGTLVVDGTNQFRYGTAAVPTDLGRLFLNTYRTTLPPAASSLVVNGDGTLFARNTGQNLRDPSSYGHVQKAAGTVTQRYADATVQLQLERYTAFGRGEYEVSDGITLYGQVNYATCR